MLRGARDPTRHHDRRHGKEKSCVAKPYTSTYCHSRHPNSVGRVCNVGGTCPTPMRSRKEMAFHNDTSGTEASKGLRQVGLLQRCQKLCMRARCCCTKHCLLPLRSPGLDGEQTRSHTHMLFPMFFVSAGDKTNARVCSNFRTGLGPTVSQVPYARYGHMLTKHRHSMAYPSPCSAQQMVIMLWFGFVRGRRHAEAVQRCVPRGQPILV